MGSTCRPAKPFQLLGSLTRIRYRPKLIGRPPRKIQIHPILSIRQLEWTVEKKKEATELGICHGLLPVNDVNETI